MRIWVAGDPEPKDHPDVIDAEGSLWKWCEYDDLPLAEVAGNWWCIDGDSDLWEWDKVLEYGPVAEAES